MSHLRTLCRPHAMFASFACCRHQAWYLTGVPFQNPKFEPRLRSLSPPPSALSAQVDSRRLLRVEPRSRWFRLNQRRTAVRASNWTEEKSPYETLELERDADEEQIKVAYRRLAKYYHPDGFMMAEGHSKKGKLRKLDSLRFRLLMNC